MAETPEPAASGPTRALPIEARIYLTELKAQKPAYAPYIAAIQSVYNEYFTAVAYIAYALGETDIPPEHISTTLSNIKSRVSNRLGILGVTVTLDETVAARTAEVAWQVQKGTNTATGSYTITGDVEDFSDDWLESKDLAVARWGRWAQTVDEDYADMVLNASAKSYYVYMTTSTTNPDHLLAAIKHSIKMAGVDRAMYVSHLQGAVSRFDEGYQRGVDKYREVMRWVVDGLIGAARATISTVSVL